MNTKEALSYINCGKLDSTFERLYGKSYAVRQRYIKAICEFEKLYGEREISLFSVPGRSELSGNHTDHNKGCVIACSVNLDIIAVAAKTNDGVVRIKSEGFEEDIYIKGDRIKAGTSCSIIAGVADGIEREGYACGGYVAYTSSNVLKGSGLSSSAAFENMVGTIFNHFYNAGSIDSVKIAQISQYAENKFYGKPCGLMDQAACSVGGVIAIDFEDSTNPKIEKLDINLKALGYSLCIVDTHGSHAGLTDEYAAIPYEMKSVAKYFEKEVLREVDRREFFGNIAKVRVATGDRAVLRAIHFFNENDRVALQTQAIKAGDFEAFLDISKKSGISSFCYLQNVFAGTAHESVALALSICETLLSDKKVAWRVHGGGFAGTIQAFVPLDFVDEFKAQMDEVFSKGSCMCLDIRHDGAIKLEL